MRRSPGVRGSSCVWDPARSGHSQAAVWVASLGFSPAVTIGPPSTVYPGNESDLVNVMERKLVTKKKIQAAESNILDRVPGGKKAPTDTTAELRQVKFTSSGK